MLEIKPIHDSNEQKEILSRCGITFKEGHFAYKAYDGTSLLGAAQFDIVGSYAVIDSIRQAEGTTEDFEGMFILGRAVLNFLDLCGVDTARSQTTDEAERRLLKCIGFHEDNEKLEAVLKGMFDGHCAGHGGCSS
jgi:hypothetical protein